MPPDAWEAELARVQKDDLGRASLAAAAAALLLWAGPLAASAAVENPADGPPSSSVPEDSPAQSLAPGSSPTSTPSGSSTPSRPVAAADSTAVVTPPVGREDAPDPAPRPVVVAPGPASDAFAWPLLSVLDASGRPLSGAVVDFAVCTQDAGKPRCATASEVLDPAQRTIGADDPLLARTVVLPAGVTWVSVDVTLAAVPGPAEPPKRVLRAHWNDASGRWLDNDGDNDDQVLTWHLSTPGPPPGPRPSTTTGPRPTSAQLTAEAPRPSPESTGRDATPSAPTVAGPPGQPVVADIPGPPRPTHPLTPVPDAPGPAPTDSPAPVTAATAEVPSLPRPTGPRPTASPTASPVARPVGVWEGLLASPLTPMLGGAAVAIAVILAAFPPAGPTPRR